jgi:hypothetical protein
MGCGFNALGGATTTASVDFARAYISRSVPTVSPVNRLPGSVSMSVTPAAAQRRMTSAVCGWSAAAAVIRTRRGSQRRTVVGGAEGEVSIVEYNTPDRFRLPHRVEIARRSTVMSATSWFRPRRE